MATIRARYEKGVLTPLEPLDLEEGKEVVVSVQDAPTPGGEDRAKVSEDTGESLLEMFDRLRKSVPPEAWDGLRPRTLSRTRSTISTAIPKKRTDANAVRRLRLLDCASVLRRSIAPVGKSSG